MIPCCVYMGIIFCLWLLIYQFPWIAMFHLGETDRCFASHSLQLIFPYLKGASMPASCFTLQLCGETDRYLFPLKLCSMWCHGWPGGVQGGCAVGRGSTDMGWDTSWRKSKTAGFRDDRKKEIFPNTPKEALSGLLQHRRAWEAVEMRARMNERGQHGR